MKLVTARNEVAGKVMFLHLWVILFTRRGWGVPVQVVSIEGCLCPGGVSVQGGLCLGGVCPGGVSLGGGGGLCQADPPYGNMWAVRILLECILVDISVFRTSDEMGGEFTSSVQVKLTPFQLHPL